MTWHLTLQYDPAPAILLFNSLTYDFVPLCISCNFGKFQY